MKPSIPKGTRDFSPVQMAKRNFIFDNIRKVFALYGFQQIETPAMENLATLTGKYGDEGDQLIFKILNSGDYLAAADAKLLEEKNSKKLTSSLAEKALRYDLTVPFARFVVQNRNDIVFPFRRFQIQPVWRADRPQKARYREFYQCDADIIGSDSLISEVELIQMADEVFEALKLNVIVKINNRKVLFSIAEAIGEKDRFREITTAIDKLDKIGVDKVSEELLAENLSATAVSQLKEILAFSGSNHDKMKFLKTIIGHTESGAKGISEMEFIFNTLENTGKLNCSVEFDITLARGLNYYTGAIIEVKAADVSIGSISGGGRYDDLTGIFGMPGVSGIGISFGADRIYDAMDELNLFPDVKGSATWVLFANFGNEDEAYSLKCLSQFRKAGIPSEMYPDSAKFKKQFGYADSRGIPFVIVAGEEERKTETLSLKNMKTGEQERLSIDEVISKLRNMNLND